MKTIEVRCCCDVKKVLGHISIPESLIRNHQPLCFPLELEGDTHVYFAGAELDRPFMQTLETEVCSYYLDMGLVEGFAIKSSNYPMSDWKKVRGFEPNPDFTGEET